MTKQLFKKQKNKKAYLKPIITKVKLDNQISMVMMSPLEEPPGEPYDHVSINPFK